MLTQSRRRLGPTFTLEIAYEGKWVIVSDPEMVKQVFTGDPKVFHAGEGNEILAPLLGRNSVLVLDEKRHMSQRKLLLPPFHGERMQGYAQTMGEIAEREIDSWPSGTPYKLRPRMQALTLDIILRTVFGVGKDGKHKANYTEGMDLLAKYTLIAEGVRENRGAGAGCTTPSCVTKILRSAMCG